MRDIYQEITDKIVAQLEQGNVPWLKPWSDAKAGCSITEPHNALSGRAYNGINWLVLSAAPYQSKGWLTYKQAQQLGGNVRKGERGTAIVFWKFDRKHDATTGKDKVIPFARGYTVFNLEQCENLDMTRVKLPVPPTPGETNMNAIAARVGASVRHGGNQAFFTPTADYIAMPSADAFSSSDAYEATLAHELTHWTGHKSRLNREFGARFGNETYAFEELIAELGSAFLCARTGVPLEGLHHTGYIASWIKVLQNDKRAIFTASSKAKMAAEFLLPEPEAIEAADDSEVLPIAA